MRDRTEGIDRRAQLLDKMADAIAESGIEGVSVRAVATRADVAIGTVQYHFATKTDMLVAAWDYVRDEAASRFRRTRVEDLEPAEQLLALTELLLTPTPEDRLTRVWLALVARAAHDPRIAELHRAQWTETEALLRRVLAQANPARAAESRDAATELLALLDGLSISVITEPGRVTPESARRITRAWVRRWLGQV